MDKAALVIIVGPSLVVSASYAIISLTGKKTIAGGDVFDVFWKSAGFMGGILVATSQFIEPLKTLVGNAELYICAACVYVCFETFEAVRKKFMA